MYMWCLLWLYVDVVPGSEFSIVPSYPHNPHALFKNMSETVEYDINVIEPTFILLEQRHELSCLAVVMGHHQRLGGESLLCGLETELLSMVIKALQQKCRCGFS